MTNQFDDGIPLPDKSSRKDKFGLAGMGVGQSKFIPKDRCFTTSSLSTAAKLLNSAGCKFACRAVVENAVEGTRIWRIE